MRTIKWVAGLILATTAALAQTQPRTIEILADKDSQYKIGGKASPTITLHVGEQVKLVITARKAKNMNRDGSVHGFALLRRDGAKVANWNLLLHEGVQEFICRLRTKPASITWCVR